jgi:branched-chain amino acid transport system ATP-binding protein
MSNDFLVVENLTVHHGQLCAVNDVTFKVERGEVFAMIGANGAGKSSLMRTIAGLQKPTSGSLFFKGQDISKMPPHKRVDLGVSLVPEGRRLFASMTLEENLQVGAFKANKGPFDIKRIYGLFPWMPERRKQLAWQFSGGEQQAIALGRALLTNPELLLIDELSLGLAPIIIERIYALIPDLVKEGLSVMIVEQDVAQGLAVANRIHCLLEGHTSLIGTPGELSADAIERAYFGADLSSSKDSQ